jgi:hypothetical protein
VTTPRVADRVHYVSYGTPGGEYTSQCRAAIVAGVPVTDLPVVTSDGVAMQLDLVVLNPTGLFFNRCHQSEHEFRGGTWHTLDACA